VSRLREVGIKQTVKRRRQRRCDKITHTPCVLSKHEIRRTRRHRWHSPVRSFLLLYFPLLSFICLFPEPLKCLAARNEFVMNLYSQPTAVGGQMKVISSMWMHLFLLHGKGIRNVRQTTMITLWVRQQGERLSDASQLPSFTHFLARLTPIWRHIMPTMLTMSFASAPPRAPKTFLFGIAFVFNLPAAAVVIFSGRIASSSCPKLNGQGHEDRQGTWLCFCRPLPWKTINIKTKFVRSQGCQCDPFRKRLKHPDSNLNM